MATPQTDVVDRPPQEAHVLLEPRNRAEIDTQRIALVAQAERELPDEIISPQEYAAVGGIELRLAEYIDRVEPVFDEHVAAANKVWKTACAIRAMFIDGPKAFKAKCRRLRGAWEQKEEAGRRAEERRIAEQERQRQLTVQREEAKLLDKQGQKEMAAAVRQQPVYAPPVVLPRNVPQVAGIRPTRKNWTWRFAGSTDPDGGRKDPALRKQAAMMMPREYLTPDDASLTSIAKSMKGTVRVPGIEFYEEKV